MPYVFTQEGIAMLSGILNSGNAVQVNIAIMRAFVQMRQILFANSKLSYKMKELEGKIGKHDKEIAVIFGAIKELMSQPEPIKKRRIGF